MQEFSYEDYCYNLKMLGTHSLRVCEDGEEYTYDINNVHDKIFRDLLSDKIEVSNFINEILKLKYKIKAEELQEYNTNFITKDYRNRQSDIIYKLKSKNIYFLIEHQSVIDYLMLYRVYEYSMEIMRRAINESKAKMKDFVYPKIIPVVLYTGNIRWDAKSNITYINEKLVGYKKEDIIIKYNLIDINEYEIEELVNKQTCLEKVMAIEKCKTREKLKEVIEKIVEVTKDNKAKEKMSRIINYILKDIIGEQETKKLIEKLNKEEETNMLKENLLIEKQMLLKEGKKEGMKKVIKNMIKVGETDEKIKLYTGFSYKQIQELRKEIV